MNAMRWLRYLIGMAVLFSVIIPVIHYGSAHAQDAEDDCQFGEDDRSFWLDWLLESRENRPTEPLWYEPHIRQALATEIDFSADTSSPEYTAYYFLTNAFFVLPEAFDVTGLCIGIIDLDAPNVEPATIYDGPGMDNNIVGAIDGFAFAIIIGRNTTGDWLLVQSGGVTGWVQASSLIYGCDRDELPVYEATPANTRQSFNFRSSPDSFCSSAPHGLVIDAPAEVNLIINGYELQVAGSVFLSTPTDDTMTVQTLEGEARLGRPLVNEVFLTLDDSAFSVGVDPIPLEGTLTSLDQLDLDEGNALGVVLDALYGQPNEVATVTFRQDSGGDTYACDTEAAADDPKVDIYQFQFTNFLSGSFQVNTWMLEPVTEEDFSFGVDTILVNAEFLPIIVLQGWQHDGETGEGGWMFDMNAGDYVPMPGTSSEIDYETGIIRYQFERTGFELDADFEALPDIEGVYVESSHTPTSDLQPQPTYCDDAFAPINPREFRMWTGFRI